MRRELLKRALEHLIEGICYPDKLIAEIETYLAQPEPEPVAYCYAWIDDDGDEVNRLGFTVPSEGFDAIPLYTTPPDQSAQIAALKRELQQADEDYVSVEEAYLQCQKDLYDEAEKLAALQAKRDPLSDDEIQDIHNELPSRSTYYEFARAIEAAHGIGTNHD